MDKNNLALALQATQSGETSPTNGVWRTVDNVNVEFSDVELVEFATAALKYLVKVLQVWADHKDAIAAIVPTEDKTIDQQCAEYDITVGWPVDE